MADRTLRSFPVRRLLCVLVIGSMLGAGCLASSPAPRAEENSAGTGPEDWPLAANENAGGSGSEGSTAAPDDRGAIQPGIVVLEPTVEVPPDAGPMPRVRPAVIAIYDPYIFADHPAFHVSSAEYEALWLASGAPGGVTSYSTQAWAETPHKIPARTLVGISNSRVFGAFDANLGTQSASYEGTNPHGTKMAGAVLDARSGSCPECLVVQVFERHAWAWIAQQNWIDAVVIAMGSVSSPTEGISVMVQAVVDSGKPVFVAGGNSMYDLALRTPQDVVTSDTVLVEMTRGGRIGDEHPPFPDLATEGVFDLPTLNGTWAESSGSSFAAPRLAGYYGRFLMEAWKSGAMEREALPGGAVRHVMTGEHPADYLADGVLHSRDVPLLFASVALRAYETTPISNSTNQLAQAVDPSARVGYGQVQEPQMQALLTKLANGALESAPPPGAAHALHLLARAQARDAAIAIHDGACPVVPFFVWPIGSCADPYLESSDWYQP